MEIIQNLTFGESAENKGTQGEDYTVAQRASCTHVQKQLAEECDRLAYFLLNQYKKQKHKNTQEQYDTTI